MLFRSFRASVGVLEKVSGKSGVQEGLLQSVINPHLTLTANCRQCDLPCPFPASAVDHMLFSLFYYYLSFITVASNCIVSVGAS